MLYLIVSIAAAAFGIAAGKIKKKYSDMPVIRFEKTWVAIIALCLQIFARIMGANGIVLKDVYSIVIHGLSFGLLLLCFWFNRKYLGLWFIAMGALMNALVMAVNGGKMPVALNNAQKAGRVDIIGVVTEGFDNRHIILNESSRLWFLSDIISLPGILGYGMGRVSIGDLIVAVGLFIFITALCKTSFI